MAKPKAARPAAPQPRRRPDWLPHAAALAALAFAVYANSLANGFVSDDRIQLLKNPLVTDPANIGTILGSSVWSIIGIPGNYYRPFQFLMYMLVYQLAGFHAAAFHLLMILLHAANTVLLYLLVRRLASSRVALAAAALFAVHPIHTEVVDWIAAVPDLWVTTLALGGVLWLEREKEEPRGLRIPGHCAIYLIALLTKETGVVLLPLYGAFGFFARGRGWRELRINARLYGAMAATFALYLAMRVHALGGLAPGQAVYFHLGPAEFVLSGLVTLAQYLAALVWPADLNYFHVFQPTHAVTAGVLVSALALAAIATVWVRFRTPLISFGLFWMAVAIAPALNLTGVGLNVFAERYLYLPSAGFCWIAGWAWDRLAERRLAWAKAAGAAILLVCAVRTMARNRDWRDDVALFETTVRQSPSSGLMHNSLAGAYIERDEFDKALAEERLAVACEPKSPVFHKNLGNILLVKDPRAAVPEFEKFVVLAPDSAEGHANLGLALEAAGDRARAAAEYEDALKLEPGNREANEGLRRVR